MELIDGITLKQYMHQKGLLNWREGLHFAIQIIKALSHAHNRGIIHRDIKPHNIMILRDGSVKVADFGIARFASKQHTLTKEALGSVHYISPEQARGSHIDARSDIYSVGVVLYEMLTERLPFEGDSPVSVALQHISSLPLSPREINPEIPEALEMIILKSMAPKLTKRYASALDMLKDLEEFRKNPSISFEYDTAELQTAADEGPDGATRPLPGGAGSRGGLKNEAEERKRIKKELIDEENRKTRKSGNVIATLSAVLGVLVLIAILGFVIMGMVNDWFGGQSTVMVDVPHLRHTTFTSIEELEQEYRDLRFDVQRSYSAEHEVNIIIDQDPLSGQVRTGTVITLTVSTGREPVEYFENLAGMSQQEAQNWLTNNDLRFERSRNILETHDTVPRNHVISTDPPYGSELFKGDLVILTISQGPEAPRVTMPVLLGRAEDEAIETLTQYNLRVGNVTSVASDEPAGTVIGQSVPGGEMVEENTEISLELSDGSLYEEPPVPPSPTDDDDPPIPPSPTDDGDPPMPPPELITFEQPIGIPTDREGTTTLTVERNSNRFFEEVVRADESPVIVTIIGFPDDLIRVWFDGTMIYERTVAALQQQLNNDN
jgi:serine/threonine-protein kinase